MKSLIKTLLISLLAAALCMLIARVGLTQVLIRLVPTSLQGAWWFWANLMLAGFLAGLLVSPLLSTRRYHPVPLLLLFSALVVLGNWSQSRCNDAQLQAIQQLEMRSQSHSNLGFSNEALPPSAPLEVNTPGVWADEQGYGFGYSCIRPGETLSFLLTGSMDYFLCVIGVFLALLIVPRRRAASLRD